MHLCSVGRLLSEAISFWPATPLCWSKLELLWLFIFALFIRIIHKIKVIKYTLRNRFINFGKLNYFFIVIPLLRLICMNLVMTGRGSAPSSVVGGRLSPLWWLITLPVVRRGLIKVHKLLIRDICSI